MIKKLKSLPEREIRRKCKKKGWDAERYIKLMGRLEREEV